mgnify:CR=1 FL=1
MKIRFLLLLFCLILHIESWAVGKHFSFRCLQKVVDGNSVYYENRLHSYFFSMEIIADEEGTKPEYQKHGYPFVQAAPEQRYSVRIHNPMPVRVAVNLMIDGLNSISGNPSSPASGTKWIIDPHSSIVIRGWQVNESSVRRFYFTRIEDSYAQWQSHRLGQDLTIKCGIISAAYFWSRKEMEGYLERNPIYRKPAPSPIIPYYDRKAAPKGYAQEEKMRSYDNERAGTGMGEKDSHPVETVNFFYDMGMYNERDMLKIFYDFGYPQHRPYYRPYEQPYEDGFAPEKP